MNENVNGNRKLFWKEVSNAKRGKVESCSRIKDENERLAQGENEVFKMIHSIDRVNLEKIFCIDEDGRARKHSLHLKIRRHVNSSIGLKFFARSY